MGRATLTDLTSHQPAVRLVTTRELVGIADELVAGLAPVFRLFRN